MHFIFFTSINIRINAHQQHYYLINLEDLEDDDKNAEPKDQSKNRENLELLGGR